MTKTFSETIQLDDPSTALLSNLIGQKIYTIHAPCLQVAGQHFTAPSLSIVLGTRQWLNLRCEWFEAPYTRADYWRMSISRDDRPSGIGMRSDGAIVAPCTICFFEAEPISSIVVFSTRWDWVDPNDEEHLIYDSALLFETQAERSFCIWCQLDGPGIATEVHFTQDRDLINQVLEGSAPRSRLD
jgi:hypothetical protein